MPAVASIMAKDREFGRNEATLVISVWYEAEHAEPFRARLTSTSGEASEVVIIFASNRESVLSRVSEWLSKLPNE
ncbi:UNVERIFIED_ORG: hypothetical protein J2X79_004235 [Arthrobacter globiformis]|nr:hypothetical protein [Arthrobacter globiformis]